MNVKNTKYNFKNVFKKSIVNHRFTRKNLVRIQIFTKMFNSRNGMTFSVILKISTQNFKILVIHMVQNKIFLNYNKIYVVKYFFLLNKSLYNQFLSITQRKVLQQDFRHHVTFDLYSSFSENCFTESYTSVARNEKKMF